MAAPETSGVFSLKHNSLITSRESTLSVQSNTTSARSMACFNVGDSGAVPGAENGFAIRVMSQSLFIALSHDCSLPLACAHVLFAKQGLPWQVGGLYNVMVDECKLEPRRWHTD